MKLELFIYDYLSHELDFYSATRRQGDKSYFWVKQRDNTYSELKDTFMNVYCLLKKFIL